MRSWGETEPFRIPRPTVDLSSILCVLPDRRILERTVFPYILERKECHRIVFVGCRWYTKRYNATFADKDYCTIDIDPKQKKYGANNHIVDSLENLATHFKPNELDVIICNGVFGWGLNDKPAVERAFAASFDCLRIGGLLVVGWNDTTKRRPFSLDECDALRHFDRFTLEGLGTWRYKTRSFNRHIFDFYAKGREV